MADYPFLNVSRYIHIAYQDGTTQTTSTAPTLGGLPGQISQTQMPTDIGAGTSLQSLDIGTF